MTRVLVPYTDLHPETSARLDRFAPDAERVQLDPDDPHAYWRLMLDAWGQPGDLIVIEHDVGVTAEVVPGFIACPEPWCGHPYPIATAVGVRAEIALGCVRFREELRREVPALDDLAEQLRHWRALHRVIQHALTNAGYTPHAHDPEVAHFDYDHPIGGCYSRPPFRFESSAGLIRLPSVTQAPAALFDEINAGKAGYFELLEALADDATVELIMDLPMDEVARMCRAWSQYE